MTIDDGMDLFVFVYAVVLIMYRDYFISDTIRNL
jgi:hypothetical protein